MGRLVLFEDGPPELTDWPSLSDNAASAEMLDAAAGASSFTAAESGISVPAVAVVAGG